MITHHCECRQGMQARRAGNPSVCAALYISVLCRARKISKHGIGLYIYNFDVINWTVCRGQAASICTPHYLETLCLDMTLSKSEVYAYTYTPPAVPYSGTNCCSVNAFYSHFLFWQLSETRNDRSLSLYVDWVPSDDTLL
jgi:hypothetical protein